MRASSSRGTHCGASACGPGWQRPRQRRPPTHRHRRERKAQAGMLLQLDASQHAWLAERGPRLSLIAAIDDATGTVPGGGLSRAGGCGGLLGRAPSRGEHRRAAPRRSITTGTASSSASLAGAGASGRATGRGAGADPGRARLAGAGHRLDRGPLAAGQGSGRAALRHAPGPARRRVAAWRSEHVGRGQSRSWPPTCPASTPASPCRLRSPLPLWRPAPARRPTPGRSAASTTSAPSAATTPCASASTGSNCLLPRGSGQLWHGAGWSSGNTWTAASASGTTASASPRQAAPLEAPLLRARSGGAAPLPTDAARRPPRAAMVDGFAAAPDDLDRATLSRLLAPLLASAAPGRAPPPPIPWRRSVVQQVATARNRAVWSRRSRRTVCSSHSRRSLRRRCRRSPHGDDPSSPAR